MFSGLNVAFSLRLGACFDDRFVVVILVIVVRGFSGLGLICGFLWNCVAVGFVSSLGFGVFLLRLEVGGFCISGFLWGSGLGLVFGVSGGLLVVPVLCGFGVIQISVGFGFSGRLFGGCGLVVFAVW